MRHPFHAIIADAAGKYLYGACSDRVQKYSLESGRLEAEYVLTSSSGDDNEPTEEQTQDAAEPPAKKAKTEGGEQEKKKSSGSNNQEGPKAVRELRFSRSGAYVIATEAKSVLVLSASDLTLHSQRTFPKRPSAVVTTVDDADLLVGDKFGDAYAVPLLSKDALVVSSSEAAKAEAKANKSIEPILGHVSMLVDMTLAEGAGGKQYVITADRDEHIRVSQYPKSFIVERWLFGHKEFVSSLCLLPWQSNILVSGGGDEFLAVWDWTEGKSVQQFDIRALIAPYLTAEFHTALRKGGDLEISVARIVALPQLKQVAVLCEATSVVLVLQVDEQTHTLSHVATLENKTGARVVDISASESNTPALIASLDGPDVLVAAYSVVDGKLVQEETESAGVAEINGKGSVERSDAGKEFPLYSIKHLRKRGEF